MKLFSNRMNHIIDEVGKAKTIDDMDKLRAMYSADEVNTAHAQVLANQKFTHKRARTEDFIA